MSDVEVTQLKSQVIYIVVLCYAFKLLIEQTKTSSQNNMKPNTCSWCKHLEITGTFWNVCTRIKGSLLCVSAFRPMTRKRLLVHARAATETQTGSEPCCSFFCLCTVFALRAFVLPSVLQLASCIYQLLTKLHYHYPLWGAGSAHLTDVPQTNIQQLLAQIYPIKKRAATRSLHS